MATKNQATAQNSDVDEHQAKTRLLLALWDMGGAKADVKKRELTDRIKRKKEKSGDYQQVFEQLQEAGAIAIETKKRVASVSLKDKGLEMLSAGLKSSDFYDPGVGAKTANALLKWIREMETSSNGALPAARGKVSEEAIASYDEFKQVALDIIDYQKFNLTRGCLVRTKEKKIHRQWESYGYLNELVHKLGGEWVALKAEEIRPLIDIYSVYQKRDSYQLSEEQVRDFSKQITIENELLREILSNPSGEIDEETIEDDIQLVEDFLNPSSIDETDDSDDLGDLFN